VARITQAELEAAAGPYDRLASAVPVAIADANVFVTAKLADKGLTAGQLKSIELYIAAHLLSPLRFPKTSASSSGRSASRQGS